MRAWNAPSASERRAAVSTRIRRAASRPSTSTPTFYATANPDASFTTPSAWTRASLGWKGEIARGRISSAPSRTTAPPRSRARFWWVRPARPTGNAKAGLASLPLVSRPVAPGRAPDATRRSVQRASITKTASRVRFAPTARARWCGEQVNPAIATGRSPAKNRSGAFPGSAASRRARVIRAVERRFSFRATTFATIAMTPRRNASARHPLAEAALPKAQRASRRRAAATTSACLSPELARHATTATAGVTSCARRTTAACHQSRSRSPPSRR